MTPALGESQTVGWIKRSRPSQLINRLLNRDRFRSKLAPLEGLSFWTHLEMPLILLPSNS